MSHLTDAEFLRQLLTGAFDHEFLRADIANGTVDSTANSNDESNPQNYLDTINNMIENFESDFKDFAEGATQSNSTFNQFSLEATPHQQVAKMDATDNIESRHCRSITQSELANEPLMAGQADVGVHCLSMSPNLFSGEAELNSNTSTADSVANENIHRPTQSYFERAAARSTQIPTIPSSRFTFPPFHPQSLTPGMNSVRANTPAQSIFTPVGGHGALPLPYIYHNSTDGVLDGSTPLKRLEKRKRLVDSTVDGIQMPSPASSEGGNNYISGRTSGMGLTASRINSHNAFPTPLRFSYQPPTFHPRPSTLYTAHHQNEVGVASASMHFPPSSTSLYPAQTSPVPTHSNQREGSYPSSLYPSPPQSSTSTSPLPAPDSFHSPVQRRRSIWLYVKQSEIPSEVICRWKESAEVPECGFPITSKESAEAHLREAHGEDSDFRTRVCRWAGCSQKFKSGAFPPHFHRIHHPFCRVYCEKCRKGFQEDRALQKHREGDCDVEGDVRGGKRQRRV